MSLEAGLAGAREGMSRVMKGANPEWVEAVSEIVRSLARSQETLTADDIFAQGISVETNDNRALGPIMKRIQKEGLIEPTQTFIKSTRAELHATDIRVWKSLVRA